MNDHTDCKRGFYWGSKSWHWSASRVDGVIDVVNFGMYHKDGGTTGEMLVEWKELSGQSVPQLKAYDDSWIALSLFADVIQILGEHDDENISPKDVVEILKRCGFEDLTVYENPYQ